MISSLRNIKQYSIRKPDGKIIEKYRFKQTAIYRLGDLRKVYGELNIYKNGVKIE